MSLIEPTFTVGIEEEYHLVDRQTRDLVAEAPTALMAACEAKLGGQVSPEFLRSQIEIGTRPCRTIPEAHSELVRLRGTIASEAARNGLAPIAASTHPFACAAQQLHTDKDRYHVLATDLAGVGRRLVVCGMHVHVGIEDDELRIDLINQARYFLPHLLVLATSSPFWEGEDTGLKSWRLAIFRELPRTGLPGRFGSFDEYRSTVDVLVKAKVIDDASKIWWDLRPSARFKTIELRVTDVCTRLQDALTVAALFQCLCRMLFRLRRNNLSWRSYPVFLLEENRWRAQRYGVGGTLFDFGKGELVPIASLMEEVLDLIREDASALGCEAHVLRAREIISSGTSADRQVASFHEAMRNGTSRDDALKTVVDHLISETCEGLA
ncbi:MAG: carboxylate-amine ligase [Hyphomicrobiaceae bacterium]